jgi:hypothetical protein
MGARNIPGVACLEHVSRGGCGHRFKVYPIAEPLTPLGPPIDRIMPPPFVEVVRAQLGTLLLDSRVVEVPMASNDCCHALLREAFLVQEP